MSAARRKTSYVHTTLLYETSIESLIPETEKDVEKTIALKNMYTSNNYSKSDYKVENLKEFWYSMSKKSAQPQPTYASIVKNDRGQRNSGHDEFESKSFSLRKKIKDVSHDEKAKNNRIKNEVEVFEVECAAKNHIDY